MTDVVGGFEMTMDGPIFGAERSERLDEVSNASPGTLKRADSDEEALDPLVVGRLPDPLEDVVQSRLGGGERIVLRSVGKGLQEPKLANHRLVRLFVLLAA